MNLVANRIQCSDIQSRRECLNVGQGLKLSCKSSCISDKHGLCSRNGFSGVHSKILSRIFNLFIKFYKTFLAQLTVAKTFEHVEHLKSLLSLCIHLI